MRVAFRHAFIGLTALAIVLGACGDDDGAETTAADASPSAPEPATGSATGSGSATAAAAAEKPCEPVGEELEARAATTLDVQLADYAFVPAELEAQAGVVTFATTNVGEEAHELAFLPGGGDVPFTEEGVPDEAALEEAGAFELEAYGPGQDCNATYDLDPGTYTIFCIVEAPDGETHYEKGMAGTVVVN